jgi:septum formation protein
MSVILASNSPRRRELLEILGLDFRVIPANVDEVLLSDESPTDYVIRVAVNKAEWVRNQQISDTLIIAADTTVVVDGHILGKPKNEAEAGEMLRLLRGRNHQVFTGIAAARNGKLVPELCGTDVPMRQYSDEDIRKYIASGDPFDKAGAYAIQNTSFNPVESINGCFTNVMGLPLCNLTRALRKFEIFLDVDISGECQKFTGHKCQIYNTILADSQKQSSQP